MDNRTGSFLAALQRRRVYKVGAGYIVVGLGVLGAAELILDPLGLGALRPYVVVLTLLGFPLALVLAWAYEPRSDGDAGHAGGSAATEPRESEDDSVMQPETKSLDPRRLAVLPFASIHAERDQDYFADGITEELISVISRVHGLDVIARTSVMAYRETTKSVSDIGHELNVGTVLEGSVRKAGDQLRITAQLIDVGTQAHLWSHDYDREMREVFQVQADVARNVAEALEIQLLGEDERRIAHVPTGDAEAYDLYLLGRHHLNKRTDSGIRRAIEFFEKAAALDESFALAHAGLADAYILASIGYAAIADAGARAAEAATRALEIDSELSEARTSLGYVRMNHDWDLRSAEAELAQAIDLKPSNAQAYQWYAHVEISWRRYEQADHHFDRARELDPLSVTILNESGWPAFYRGDLASALLRFQKATTIDPSYAMAYFNIGNVYEADGRLDEAVHCYRRAVDLSDRTALMVGGLAASLARAGRTDEARALYQELSKQAEKGAALSVWLAVIDEALGDTSAALDRLENALRHRESGLGVLNTRFLPFRSLRDEPRYRKLLQELSALWGWDSSEDGTDASR